MYNFKKGKKSKNDEKESSINEALENKIFYAMKGVGQGQNQLGNTSRNEGKKKHSKAVSTDFSVEDKINYSIKDILQMDISELNSKIFSFESETTTIPQKE